MKMAEMRIQTDLNNLPEEPWFEIPPPDPNNLFLQEIEIVPPEGFWVGARYKFRCHIPKDYPFSPPKLHCDTLVYHPNIDLSGNVCISILKNNGKPEGWSIQRSLTDVLFGIAALFTEPNVDDPLNFEAADLLAKQPEEFKKLVRRTLKGETVTVNKESRKFEKLVN
uniref:UBC core domain-containing protein n=1 Tax=Arcella intermedia TaxID=1963864 RepID=A0A6B2LK33_9EUKA